MSQSDNAMRTIYLYTKFERFWHWFQAALIMMLLLTGFVLQGAGFVPNEEQTMTVKLAMVTLYGLFPLVCYVIGAALFSRFKLDEAEHAKIREVLDERNGRTA